MAILFRRLCKTLEGRAGRERRERRVPYAAKASPKMVAQGGRGKRVAMKAATKKVVGMKASTKKAVPKKVATKQATKKSAAKIATATKKTAMKKVATKQAATKGAAKKVERAPVWQCLLDGATEQRGAMWCDYLPMYQDKIEEWWKAVSTGSVGQRLELDGGYRIEWVTDCAVQVGSFGTRRVLRRVVPS